MCVCILDGLNAEHKFHEFHATVSVGVAVTSLPALLAIKVSAQNQQDVRLTDPGWSCEKSANSDHWPVSRCIFNIYIYIYI